MSLSMTRRTLLAGGLAAVAVPGSAVARDRSPVPPTWVSASVHDPDLVRSGRWSYVFGSHAAFARTDDLLRWEQLGGDGLAASPLFEDGPAELAEALSWARASTLWAPGVTQLRDGRWAYYYCACEGTSPRSAMGLAVADQVTGPYRDTGLLLRSGMGQGEEDPTSEDGTPYDARVHPNVIDADLVTDAEGRPWMVYGSFSGGIFLLELDPGTGRPLPGQGYGQHLMGGNHARIEGPAVLHHPGSGWYYLFVTFGGLDAHGGYNVRVARARELAGPWRDVEGTDMSTVRADPDLPLFDDASIAPHGVKLLGNHQFRAPDGTPGHGYVSPGGVSAELDPTTGEPFLVFHTRFPGQGERHELRTHPMALTADGWPLVLPLPHDGRRDPRPVRGADVPGRYQVVHHRKPITADVATPVEVELHRDGRVSGGLQGRWRPSGRSRAVLDVQGGRHQVVLARQWSADADGIRTTFAALAPDGTTLAGIAR
ncbi:family 43 glycosylhydrolase [Auraticoccus sp. F435]|uniref:Family 43 glycosylhydrolase n=1 Tax=Auraticoccus cholistanensis TaxID=2656650 RepID=A0A6A9UWG4_9ACTN|nr:glycoside hydrolase family 43 protein [Auraticoccus cholistanensis]MVA77071.1 family 43 glycosylhydrolase [Auraticoccus cholistanensis]